MLPRIARLLTALVSQAASGGTLLAEVLVYKSPAKLTFTTKADSGAGDARGFGQVLTQAVRELHA